MKENNNFFISSSETGIKKINLLVICFQRNVIRFIFAVDVSSASECSEDSDDSTASRELTGYSCRHCFTTGKYSWY